MRFAYVICRAVHVINEHRREKIYLWGFRPGETQPMPAQLQRLAGKSKFCLLPLLVREYTDGIHERSFRKGLKNKSADDKKHEKNSRDKVTYAISSQIS